MLNFFELILLVATLIFILLLFIKIPNSSCNPQKSLIYNPIQWFSLAKIGGNGTKITAANVLKNTHNIQGPPVKQ